MKFLMQQTDETDTGITTSVVRISGSVDEVVSFLDKVPELADMVIASCVNRIVELGDADES